VQSVGVGRLRTQQAHRPAPGACDPAPRPRPIRHPDTANSDAPARCRSRAAHRAPQPGSAAWRRRFSREADARSSSSTPRRRRSAGRDGCGRRGPVRPAGRDARPPRGPRRAPARSAAGRPGTAVTAARAAGRKVFRIERRRRAATRPRCTSRPGRLERRGGRRQQALLLADRLLEARAAGAGSARARWGGLFAAIDGRI